jgi:hypothetical protein
MLPLLRDRDILEISPAESIRSGDIIIFKGRENASDWIVHRVIAARPETVHTRGDNNPCPDADSLGRNEIAGKITGRWRAGKRKTIYGGRLGFLQSYSCRPYNPMRRILSRIVRFITLSARSKNFIRHHLPQPREVHFNKNNHVKKLLYWGKIPIGIYSETKHTWQIRFPYRLLFPIITSTPQSSPPAPAAGNPTPAG